MSFYSTEQLNKMDFKHLGKNVLISDKCSIYNAANISIGDNCRIDDFAILSAGDGGIELGNYVHIACFATLIGKGKITMGDFSGLSSRVSVYSSSDDYSGSYLLGPTIPSEFTNTDHRPVEFGKYVIIGSGSVVLPGTIVQEGCCFGALSLANGEYDAYTLYAGSPAKFIKNRKRVEDHLDLDQISKYN